MEPSTNPAAILGSLPFTLGPVTLPVPTTVVPTNATGILVFAWAALSGANPAVAYWHVASTLADGTQNWFSLLVVGDPNGGVTCNSQEFWLPPTVTGNLIVTLYANDLPSASNRGEVEIHGYRTGADSA